MVHVPKVARVVLAGLFVFGLGEAGAVAGEQSAEAVGRRLVSAYPGFLTSVQSGVLVWKDGTRMVIDSGRGLRSPAQIIDDPDIKDMFAWRYPSGAPATAPAPGIDPGRARYQPLFDKMYGECARGQTTGKLVEIVWLPKKAGQRLKVTSVNGVAEKLAAVSRALDEFPAALNPYLFPAAGTYNCRPIAGTKRPSAHGAGIAIDIALKHAHYWRWTKPDGKGQHRFRNSIPPEIVDVFERHGFIWGGRWYHYDTMHFEYRPEFFARD